MESIYNFYHSYLITPNSSFYKLLAKTEIQQVVCIFSTEHLFVKDDLLYFE